MTATPLFSNDDADLAGKRLLILGGGLWQLEYVRRARQLGIETWVTDWSSSAVARDEAARFEPIDLKDRDATLALARRARVDGVLTAADIGVPTAAFVAGRLGLPGHAPALADAATDKFAMRRRSESLGIPCPAYRCVRSVAEAGAALDAVGLPAIVKPIDNCSSRGVRWIGATADVATAAPEALAASRAGAALVEQFLVGTEGSIEALVQDGRVFVLGICDKTKSRLPDRYDLELRYPGAYDRAEWSDIGALARRIASGFNMVDGILHIEFLVSRDTGTVYLIEFAIRGCGSKVATHLMPALTGIDVTRIVIGQALGVRTGIEHHGGHGGRIPLVFRSEPPRPQWCPTPARANHGALHFLMFPPGRVTAVRGVEAARRVPGVIDVCVERLPGELIDEVYDGRSRPGHVLVHGESLADVQQTISEVRGMIRIDYEDAADVPPLVS
jgi:biotin carboxylase